MEALVLAGGDALDAAWRPTLPVGARVIAADSGVAHARALGLTVDVVVGDFDSIEPADLDAAVSAGARIERHPTDKDATDLELALAAALAEGATSVTLLGAGGGRLDHFLANALLLAAPEWAGLRLQALVGEARVVVVHATAELRGAPGSLVTLLPTGGPALGVRTTGLRWRLDRETLAPGTTRGVSNEMAAPVATVALDAGVLLVIQPHARPDLAAPDPRPPEPGGP